jgi:hypothetical protein
MKITLTIPDKVAALLPQLVNAATEQEAQAIIEGLMRGRLDTLLLQFARNHADAAAETAREAELAELEEAKKPDNKRVI